MITADRLRSLLRYNPETGDFIRVAKIGKKGRIGSIVGCVSGPGYWMIGLDGGTYYAHRLAWLYMTGEWPPYLIDHRDTDKLNNRWNNLRAATKAQNAINSRLGTTNTSGLKGVSWHAAAAKWQAHCGSIYIGLFDSKESAHAAYMNVAGEFGRSI